MLPMMGLSAFAQKWIEKGHFPLTNFAIVFTQLGWCFDLV
jgi:hypothetical protein